MNWPETIPRVKPIDNARHSAMASYHLSGQDFFVLLLPPAVLQKGIKAGVIFNLLKPAIQCNPTTLQNTVYFLVPSILCNYDLSIMDSLDIHKSMNVREYYKHVEKYPIISLSMENPRHFHRTILRTIP